MSIEVTVQELCAWLEMPSEVTETLNDLEQTMDLEAIREEIRMLTDPARWEAARDSLKEKLGEDAGGVKMLLCMMHGMVHSYKKYVEKGISKEIFLDTMKCFPRFIREHKVSFGSYGFDRDFWVGRQLSLRLFRIGTLEFEIADPREAFEEAEEQLCAMGDRACVISIHIPSDSVLTAENCSVSYDRAEQFLAEYFPETAGCAWVCNSWLLSPALKELLPAESRIIVFQNQFEIRKWFRDSKEYLEWVYKRRDLPFHDLPENTSLQRRMKEYVRNGGKVGEAFGVLKKAHI